MKNFQVNVSKLTLAILIMMGGVLLLGPKAAFASTLSFSPASGNIGATITPVQVMLDTAGEAINGVTAIIKYSSDKFDVSWVDASNSAFSIRAEQTINGGVVTISRGNITPVTGKVNVATLGLKAKAVGTGLLTFSDGSAALRSSDSTNTLNLGASTGGSYSVVAANSGNNSSTLQITAITVSGISTSSLTVNWKTSVAASSEVVYGLESNNYNFTVSDNNLTTTHTVKVTNTPTTPLIPGSLVHFAVKSIDATGQVAGSGDNTAQLTGFQVTLKISDDSGRMLASVPVTLQSESLPANQQDATTDAQGSVSFTNVSPGRYAVNLNLLSHKVGQEITVADSPSTQQFSIKYDSRAISLLDLLLIQPQVRLGAILLGLVLLAGLGYLIYAKFLANRTAAPGPSTFS